MGDVGSADGVFCRAGILLGDVTVDKESEHCHAQADDPHLGRLFRFVFLAFSCLSLIGCYAGCSDESGIPDLSQAEWLVLGPFDNPPGSEPLARCQGYESDYLLEIGGEAEARPTRGLTTAGRVWTPARAANGEVDFGRSFPDMTDRVAYAYTEFESEREQQVALRIGSDDGVKVWLNGRL